MSRVADCVDLAGGVANMAAQFRDVARAANRAGLEGYHVDDVELGMDVEVARAALLDPGCDGAKLRKAVSARVLITYKRVETAVG